MPSYAAQFLLLCAVSSLVQISYSQNGTKKEVIYILTLLPYYDPEPSLNPSWPLGDNIVPAINLAVDQINNSTEILENYTIELIHAKSGCDVVMTTITSYVEHVFTNELPNVTGILGPACSSSAVAVGSLNSRPDIGLVMLHGAGTPTLENRTQFPYLLGGLGSYNKFVDELCHLVQRTGWKRLAVLFDNSNVVFKNTKQRLVKELPPGMVEFSSAIDEKFLPLHIIKEQRLRVVVVMGHLQLIQRVVCASCVDGMIFDNYQWVFVDTSFGELTEPIEFVIEKARYNCSKDDMIRTLEKSFFLINNLVSSDKNTTLVSNITYSQYTLRYDEYRNNSNRGRAEFRNSTYWATYFYDSMWAWALVLDHLTTSSTSNFKINRGHYGSTNEATAILEQFYSTSFNGASGQMSFNRSTGYTQRGAEIAQVRNGRESSVKDSLVFIPDSFPHSKTISRILGGILAFITFSQILLIAVLQVMSVVHHKRPSLKAASPKLLHLSYIGAYITAIGTLIWTLKEATTFGRGSGNEYFCQLLLVWCLPIGFTLLCVPVGARTFRIYRIFKHYMNPGPFISNPVLIGAVMAFLLVDLALALSWTALYVEGAHSIAVVCTYDAVLALFYFHKLVQLLIVTVFAHLTKKIPNRSFTTKALRVLTYLLWIVSVLGFSVFNVMEFNFWVLSLTTNLIIFVFTLCTFVPPLVPLLVEKQCHSY